MPAACVNERQLAETCCTLLKPPTAVKRLTLSLAAGVTCKCEGRFIACCMLRADTADLPLTILLLSRAAAKLLETPSPPPLKN